MNKFEFDTWQCPMCEYVITDVAMQALRFDVGCPSCRCSLAKFIPQPVSSPNPPLEPTGHVSSFS